MKLYLKGERCHSEKCAIEKRNFIPGQHGKDRAKKIVGYGLQLREKQKARRVYGVLERQFRSTFEKAAATKGITGENLMSLLERRLDSVIYRMGFGTSRAQVRESSKKNPTILAARDATAHAPAPNWIDVDREALKGRVTGMPQRSELVQIQLNEQLIVELYSK
jgi:small subunit ribosomal protein S4